MKHQQTLRPIYWLTLLLTISAPSFAQEDGFDEASTDLVNHQPSVYFSILGQVSVPKNEFRNYSNVRGGLRIEAGVPFKSNRSFSVGGNLSLIFSSPKEDRFKGLSVKTETSVIGLHPFIRWAPQSASPIKPYIDVSAGVTTSYTQTTSEVVDKPTFLEQVLFGKETEVETTTHKEQSASNLSYSLGAGLKLGKWLSVGVRYEKVRPIRYADKNNVYVHNAEIVYDTKRIPLDMLILTLGISNWGN